MIYWYSRSYETLAQLKKNQTYVIKRQFLFFYIPVISIAGCEADASAVVTASVGMIVAVRQPLVAQIARPAGLTAALPRPLARAVHASGIGHADGAILAGPSDATAASGWPPATAVLAAAALGANGCVERNMLFLFFFFCNFWSKNNKVSLIIIIIVMYLKCYDTREREVK